MPAAFSCRHTAGYLRSDRLLGIVAMLVVCLTSPSHACPRPEAIGLARIVEVDASGGPLFGRHTQLPREPDFLRPMEVVLTFDDGPVPAITGAILDALDSHCTRATFFPIGQKAVAHPDMIREIIARGHTVGTHTWSHPLDLRRRPLDQSMEEIERGFAAVAAAAGVPIAPFFRFPGLADSHDMLDYLRSRDIAAFSVDVVSNDSYIADAERLLRETLARLEARKGGIVLFHDIKASAAKVLPRLLSELRQRGYRIVHLVPKSPARPQQSLLARYGAQIARSDARRRDGRAAFSALMRGGGGTSNPERGVPVTSVSGAVAGLRDAGQRSASPTGMDTDRPWRVEVKREPHAAASNDQRD